ncbi:MAG: hypothetical protein ABIH28_00565 [archaeon]
MVPKEEELERKKDSSPTMEEVGKMLAGYGGMYFLYKRDQDTEDQDIKEYAREHLEEYVQRCISLVGSPKERKCLREIWNTEKNMLDEKSLESMLRTQKIFCDGSGKDLKEDVVRLLIESLPPKERAKYILLRKSYQEKKEKNE